MPRPRFSVVVPTRNRAETLGPCLRTCLQQDFDDYEIVVADNASTPETRDVVESLASERIRYLRSDDVLAMSANWENAVSEARGEYIHVLGDDDGLMPYGLRELDRLIRDHESPPAIRWDRGVWTWPTIAVPGAGNVLHLPLNSGVEWRRTPDVIRRIIDFDRRYDQLPMIYNSVVRHDIVDAMRAQVGRVFPTIYPDIFSGFALGWLAQRYLSVDLPMGIAGLGGRSNGVATLMQESGQPVASEFADLNEAFGFRPHPRVPLLRFDPSPMMDSFEQARDLLFPTDERFAYDRWHLTQRYLAAIPHVVGPERSADVATIKAALADSPDLQQRVDDEAEQYPPAPRASPRPEQFGWDGHALALDTTPFGLADILDLVNFAARLLGAEGGRPRFGARSNRWWGDEAARLRGELEATRSTLEVTRAKLRRSRARRKQLAHQLALAQAGTAQKVKRRAARVMLNRRAGRRRGDEETIP